jgi:hypothetical protein
LRANLAQLDRASSAPRARPATATSATAADAAGRPTERPTVSLDPSRGVQLDRRI